MSEDTIEGAEVLVQALKHQGIKFMFGVSHLPLFCEIVVKFRVFVLD